MRVSTKLGLGFGIVLLMFITISLLALRSLKYANEQLDDIVNDNVQKILIVNVGATSTLFSSR